MAPVTQLFTAASAAIGGLFGRQQSRFTLFDVPTPLSSPCDLYTAPDGDIYVSAFTKDNLIHIDRSVTPNVLTEIPIPYPRNKLPLSVLPSRFQGLGACVVQPGHDGNVWLASGVRNDVVRYNPSTGNFTFIQNDGGALGNLQPFNDMWPAEKGMYFTQTTANLLTFIEYDSLKVTNYPMPTPLAGPVGVIVIPNGDVWICEFTGQAMTVFHPSTQSFERFPVPLNLLGPGVTRAFTNGSLVWFTALLSNTIGSIDIHTKEFRSYSGPNLGIPIEDTADGNENVWYSTALSNTLQYLTTKGPKQGQITEIQMPGALDILPILPISLPPAVGIAVHWSKWDNSIWYTELLNNRIGRYQLDGTEGT